MKTWKDQQIWITDNIVCENEDNMGHFSVLIIMRECKNHEQRMTGIAKSKHMWSTDPTSKSHSPKEKRTK